MISCLLLVRQYVTRDPVTVTGPQGGSNTIPSGVLQELTDRRLRRGTFHSVPQLIDAIRTWVAHWNTDPKPFVWHAEADKIIEKVRRGRKTLPQVKAATEH